jgi:hypothetical protein
MGGHAFKGEVIAGITGDIPTPPIKKQFIYPTMDSYFEMLGKIFPGAKSIFNIKHFSPVGSVGNKPYSGDIDLAIDTKDSILFGAYTPANLAKWGIGTEEATPEDVIGWEELLVAGTKEPTMKAAIIKTEAEGKVNFKDIERWAYIYMYSKSGMKKRFVAGDVTQEEKQAILTETRVRSLLTYIAYQIKKYGDDHQDESPRIIVKAGKVSAGNVFTGFTIIGGELDEEGEIQKDSELGPIKVGVKTGKPAEEAAEGEELDYVYAQVDWMLGKADLLKFSYFSDKYDVDDPSDPSKKRRGEVKGLHRTQLMLAMFSAVGYTFSHVKGVTRKPDGKPGTDIPIATKVDVPVGAYIDDKEQIIQILKDYYGGRITEKALQNYYTLSDIVMDSKFKKNVVETYLNILQSTRADVPADLEGEWLSRSEYLKDKKSVKWKGEVIKFDESYEGKLFTGKFLDNPAWALSVFRTEDTKKNKIEPTYVEEKLVRGAYYAEAGKLLGL